LSYGVCPRSPLGTSLNDTSQWELSNGWSIDSIECIIVELRGKNRTKCGQGILKNNFRQRGSYS
jgi:hypothetical protein